MTDDDNGSGLNRIVFRSQDSAEMRKDTQQLEEIARDRLPAKAFGKRFGAHARLKGSVASQPAEYAVALADVFKIGKRKIRQVALGGSLRAQYDEATAISNRSRP